MLGCIMELPNGFELAVLKFELIDEFYYIIGFICYPIIGYGCDIIDWLVM